MQYTNTYSSNRHIYSYVFVFLAAGRGARVAATPHTFTQHGCTHTPLFYNIRFSIFTLGVGMKSKKIPLKTCVNVPFWLVLIIPTFRRRKSYLFIILFCSVFCST